MEDSPREPRLVASPPPSAPPPAPPPGAEALGPVGVGERIVALDVLRGFAILGIFFVNIRMMARPMMEAFMAPGADAAPPELWAWAFVKILCEYKFITLFSLLFGVGMSIQLMRAQAAGRPFVAMYLRRIVVLAGFGLVHALGMWYGDILFAYAGCGLLLLAMCRLKGRTLLITGLVVFLVSGVLMLGLGAVQVAMARSAEAAEVAGVAVVAVPAAEDGGETAAAAADAEREPGIGPGADGADPGAEPEAAREAEPGAPIDRAAFRAHPFRTAWRLLVSGSFVGDGWAELEQIAYGEGPLLSAFAMRSITWGIVLVNGVFSWLWRVVALFLIGAGLMKLRFFDATHAGWHRRCCAIGLSVGLLGESAAAWTVVHTEFGASWTWLLAESMRYFTSAMLAFGYVGAITLVVRAGALRPLTAALAFVGRTALTNYLAQTLVATSITYWWGLGRFGTLTGVELIGLAVAIYAAQVVASALWLRVFAMGPLEWLWRSLTYLRPLPILRS